MINYTYITNSLKENKISSSVCFYGEYNYYKNTYYIYIYNMYFYKWPKSIRSRKQKISTADQKIIKIDIKFNIIRSNVILNTILKKRMRKNFKKTLKRLLLINFNQFRKKLYFNIRNFFFRTNKYMTIGILLKSMGIYKKRDRRLTKNKKIIIIFLLKKIRINYLKYSTYLLINKFNRYLILLLKRCKFFHKIPIDCTIVNLNFNFNMYLGKKIRRIKKRLRKRLLKYEVKTYNYKAKFKKRIKRPKKNKKT